MKWNVTRRAIALAGVACAAVLLTTPEASAITLSIDSITKLGGNTASGVSGSSNRHSSYDSAVSILNGGGAGNTTPDVIGNTVAGQTRYASTQTSDDNGFLAGGANLNSTATYQIVFTIATPIAGEIYDLKIDSARIGAFVAHKEGTAGATVSLGATSGTFTAPSTSLTSLAALPGFTSVNTDTVQPFNQTGTNTIAGLMGTQTYTMTFTWTGATASANGLADAGEGVILMGLDTRLNGDVGTADDYPGLSGRTAANDGHFVTITASVVSVPEPGTFVLAGLGGLFVGLAAFRRRRS